MDSIVNRSRESCLSEKGWKTEHSIWMKDQERRVLNCRADAGRYSEQEHPSFKASYRPKHFPVPSCKYHNSTSDQGGTATAYPFDTRILTSFPDRHGKAPPRPPRRAGEQKQKMMHAYHHEHHEHEHLLTQTIPYSRSARQDDITINNSFDDIDIGCVSRGAGLSDHLLQQPTS